MRRHGVTLALGDGVAGFAVAPNGTLEVRTKSGATLPADVVILALGVRPDTAHAEAAGLAIGERGGIRVDDQMRTSDPEVCGTGPCDEAGFAGHEVLHLDGVADREHVAKAGSPPT